VPSGGPADTRDDQDGAADRRGSEEAGEVAASSTRRQANKVIDAMIEYVRRLMIDGRWKPPAAR
jgi:ribosomal protein S2